VPGSAPTATKNDTDQARQSFRKEILTALEKVTSSDAEARLTRMEIAVDNNIQEIAKLAGHIDRSFDALHRDFRALSDEMGRGRETRRGAHRHGGRDASAAP
jgi:hypothetical protein